MSPVHARLVGLAVVSAALAGVPSWPHTAASDAEEEVDLTLRDGGGSFTNSVGMKLVRVRAGKFMMGAPEGEANSNVSERPRHQVELTKDYHLGVHEVTQKQYQTVMGNNPSHNSQGGGGKAQVQGMNTDDFPVENVTWGEARQFTQKLSALPAERAAGRVYRLPTEAEWEYACRGGHRIAATGEKAAALPFHFRKPTVSLGAGQANFDCGQPYGGGAKGQMLKRTCKVGSYEPNLLGLYDVHGNVREWVADWYSTETYKGGNRRDPTGPEKGSTKTSRGGSYVAHGFECRAAQRHTAGPATRFHFIGFRVAAQALAR